MAGLVGWLNVPNTNILDTAASLPKAYAPAAEKMWRMFMKTEL